MHLRPSIWLLLSLGSFVTLQSLAAPSFGDLWGISTDEAFSRVIRFDHETGNELPGGIPTGSAGLSAPSGIAVGPDGNIYVSSRNTAQVLFYDGVTGEPLTLPGGVPGVFANLLDAAPANLLFGPDGHLSVSELFGSTVRVYESGTGNRLDDAATGLSGAGGLAFTPGGDLLVGSAALPDPPTPAMIARFEQGQPQSPFFVAVQGELAFPASLLFLPNGDLLAVDLFLDRIERFSNDGEHLGTFATIPPILPGRPSFPADIVFDPDGNLIVAVLGPTNPDEPEGNQGQLLRYDLEGNLIETIAAELEQIGALTWTPSANTIAGDFDGNNSVEPADYEKWRADFGKWVAPANGADGSGNGIVDAADFTVWRDAFGLGADAPSGHVSAAVPEPSTVLLALMAALVLLGRRSAAVPL